MKEINQQNLHQAIERLPGYEPPELVWNNIEQQLDQIACEQPLQQAIRQLRTYEPPEFIWERIDANLNEKTKVPAPVVRRLLPRLTAAAAVILLLIAAINFWPAQQASPQIVYSVVEKNTAVATFAVDWNEDEALINEVITLFEQSPKALNASNYQTLQEELTELNEAKEELEMIIQKYGQDAGTVEQLKEIELERTGVVKEMASMI